MSVARFAFGPRLKAHRERQGITLQDIAESTKIAASLLSSLERNDVSQWPKGIYRRAFLRSYARAIDMPFDSVWAEFVQLFPEDGTAPVASHFTEATQLRLTLAAETRRLLPPSKRNIVGATGDLAAILALGLSLAWVTGMSLWVSLAFMSIAYGAASTALVGGSFALWCLRMPRVRRALAMADHEMVIALQESEDAVTLADDVNAESPDATPLLRPRIFAVTSTRAVGAMESSAPRERRVADR